MAKCVAVVSGGMDSATLVWLLKNQGHEVHAISFDYGQNHKVELDYAERLFDPIDVGLESGAHGTADSWRCVDLTSITHLLSSATSSLTNPDVEVPDGRYDAESMKQTVVPNRNMIMLSIAIGFAVSIEGRFVATAVHAGDHFIYPDCRPGFIKEMNVVAITANEGFSKFPTRENLLGYGDSWGHASIYAPFLNIGKHDIAKLGNNLNVPYVDTWSCYKGGETHCGRCGTCTERKEAFRLAHVKDPTKYLDADFEIKAYQ